MKLTTKLLALTGLLLNLSSLEAADRGIPLAPPVAPPAHPAQPALRVDGNMATGDRLAGANADRGQVIATGLNARQVFEVGDGSGSRIVRLELSEAADINGFATEITNPTPEQLRARHNRDTQTLADQLSNPDHGTEAATSLLAIEPLAKQAYRKLNPKKAACKKLGTLMFWTGVSAATITTMILFGILIADARHRDEEGFDQKVWAQLNEYLDMFLTSLFDYFHERVIAYGKFSPNVTTAFSLHNTTHTMGTLTQVIPTSTDRSLAFNTTTTSLYDAMTPRALEIGRASNDTLELVTNYVVETGRANIKMLAKFMRHNITTTLLETKKMILDGGYNRTLVEPALDGLRNVTCPSVSHAWTACPKNPLLDYLEQDLASVIKATIHRSFENVTKALFEHNFDGVVRLAQQHNATRIIDITCPEVPTPLEMLSQQNSTALEPLAHYIFESGKLSIETFSEILSQNLTTTLLEVNKIIQAGKYNATEIQPALDVFNNTTCPQVIEIGGTQAIQYFKPLSDYLAQNLIDVVNAALNHNSTLVTDLACAETRATCASSCPTWQPLLQQALSTGSQNVKEIIETLVESGQLTAENVQEIITRYAPECPALTCNVQCPCPTVTGTLGNLASSVWNSLPSFEASSTPTEIVELP